MHEIFVKGWRDGGLTKGQLLSLFDLGQKEENESREFWAVLHGAELKSNKSNTVQVQTAKGVQEYVVPLFGDPEDYKHLSKEERRKETERMIGQHKGFIKADVPSMGK